MRGPQKLQPEEEEVQWEGGEDLHEREAGGEEEEEKDGDEGCWNIRRKVMKGRQLRLPASFPRATSLPRRFGRSVTPTPAREPEATQETAELNTESSRLSVRGSKKRAASTSPARNEFRRSLKERLPRQIRSLLSARGNQASKLPPKPTRKAGPVGRTWVKVYDDITYMDDSAEEYYPAVGYTGGAFKIPDAYPLPTPPTPPPARQNFVAMKGSPTPSQISEYDNVPRDEPKRELDSTEKQYQADQELILREISKQQMNEANKINVEQERPTARKRENTRYKNRRQKRSPTPVATERMTNGYHDASESQTPNNETFENIMYDLGQTEKKINVVEDDYIVPERSISPPPRPKRGMKTYETVIPKEPAPSEVVSSTASIPQIGKAEVTEVCEVTSATQVAAEVEAEKEVTEAAIGNQEEQVQPVPPKPVRGVKLYESVALAPKESAPSMVKTEEQKVPSETKEEELVPASAKESCPDAAEPIIVPPRPKRGVKLYEDVLPIKTSEVDKENVPSSTSESSKQCSASVEQSPPMPSKPVRGHKLYSSIKIENESKKPDGDAAPQNVTVEIEKANIVPQAEEKPKAAERAPPYAQVHKGKDNQLKHMSVIPVDTDVPPPIPPKKKSRQTAPSNEPLEHIPPRPSRHLKPRSRSTDVVSSPKRLKTEDQIVNGSLDPTSIDVEAPPRKPSRNTANKTGAPPRRKKPAAGGDPLIARMTIDTGKVSQVTMIPAGDEDSYENVTLQGETKINFRSRPLPPTPVPDTREVETSVNEISVTLASTITSACPAVTPVASAISSAAGPSAVATPGSESVRVEGAEPSSVDTAQHVSTADATVGSGSVAVECRGAGAQDGKLEQDIDVNLKNIESSFATLDTVLKSLQAYSGPSPTFPRKSFDTSELLAAVENEQEAASVCSRAAAESSLAGQSTPDKAGDVFVSTSDVSASGQAEQTCSNGNISKNVPEPFQGQLVSESTSPDVAISTECAQTEVAAVEVVNVQAAVVGDSSTQTAESQATDVQLSSVPQQRKQSAVENRLLPEAVTAVTVTVDDSQSVNESVIVNEVPESVSLSSEIVAPGRRLSIAAENITTNLEETFVDVDSSDIVTSAPDASTEEGGRKISVAAETVVLEFMPESAKNIVDSASQTAETASVVPSDEAEAVSVAAVSVTVGEFADTVTNTSNDPKNSSVATESVEENELAQPHLTTVTVSSSTQPAEQTDAGTSAVSSAEESIDSPPIKNDDVSKSQDTAEVPAFSGLADDALTNEGSETGPSSAPNSLEGSQTSITDDDSVVSVVTRDDLAARGSEEIVITVDTEPPSSSTESKTTPEPQEITADSSVPTENVQASESEKVVASTTVDTEPPSSLTETKATPESVITPTDSSVPPENVQDESVGLKDGVTSISCQLEGINSFLDSLVRNFSSPTESGPLEETPAEFDPQSSVAADQLPCPSSNESSELTSSVFDGSCTTNPANDLSSSIVPNSSSSYSSPPDDQISITTKVESTQCNEPLEPSAVTCSVADTEPPASEPSPQAIGSSVPTNSAQEVTEGAETAVPVTLDQSAMDAVPNSAKSIFPTEVQYEEDSASMAAPCATSTTSEAIPPKDKPKRKISFVDSPPPVSRAPPSLVDDCDRVVTTETRVVTVPPTETVFTLLNRGFGIPEPESQSRGYISLFIDGEWVRL